MSAHPEFLARYEAVLNGEQRQNRKAAKVVSDFLASAADLGRSDVERWRERLAREGYADGTIRWQDGILRAAYHANGLEWPFRRGEGPRIREREVLALAMDESLVRRLILAARAEAERPPEKRRLMPYDTLYLALATTYAMRCSELAQLPRDLVDAGRHQIFVETKKHGRQRYHLIPDAIRPYLYPALRHLAPKSPQCLNKVFRRLERLARIPHTDELAWHGFRRLIDRRLLEAGLETQAVTNFLRWKRSTTDMPSRYHSGMTIVGESGGAIVSQPMDLQTDVRAFEHHPFLPFWTEAMV